MNDVCILNDGTSRPAIVARSNLADPAGIKLDHAPFRRDIRGIVTERRLAELNKAERDTSNTIGVGRYFARPPENEPGFVLPKPSLEVGQRAFLKDRQTNSRSQTSGPSSEPDRAESILQSRDRCRHLPRAMSRHPDTSGRSAPPRPQLGAIRNNRAEQPEKG